MSQTAAIAGVTLALKTLLEASFASHSANKYLADVLVTTMPVDRARTVHHRCQLNLTLATVVENTSLRNAVGLGARGAANGAATQPLDLLYLLTTYGQDDDDIGAQQVLGAALRTLHEQPILPAIVLAEVFPHAGASGTLNQVRVTHAPLTREQIVAWWLAFHTPYRLSAAVQVTGASLG